MILKSQTLPYDDWELILVDNLSNAPVVASSFSWEWHTNSRYIREENLSPILLSDLLGMRM